MSEKDLFYPLKQYFENMNYTVEGEVKDCDILVKAGQEYMAIELKLDFNLKLILQATERQKLFEMVYVAIPVQKVKLNSKAYRQKLHLLKRLGIGLILVHPVTCEVQVVSQPVEISRSKAMANSKKKTQRTILEFEKRIIKNNVGGVSRSKITTAFRQVCYQILVALKDGPKTAAQIEIEDVDKKGIYGILYRNIYGWFEKQGQGMYGISDAGKKILTKDAEMIEKIMSSVGR